MKSIKRLVLGLLLAFSLAACGNSLPSSKANPNNKLVTDVSLDKVGEVVMELNSELTVTPTITYKDNKEVSVDTKWQSSKPSVASVNNGVVTALSGGSSVISFIAGYKMASFTVTIYSDEPVTPPVTGPTVTLSTYSRTLKEGESFTLGVTVTNSEELGVAFSSENEAVATVESSGLVTAVAEGSTNIVVNAAGKTVKCAITVIKEGGEPGPGPDPEDPDDYDFFVYFFIDYNNIDEKDETGTKLLAKFGWYYNEPIGKSKDIPANPTTALDPAFPNFIGWSTHTIIDTRDDLCDLNTYVVENAHFLFLYGIWVAE